MAIQYPVPPNAWHNEPKLFDLIAKATAESAANRCTVHVNAIVRLYPSRGANGGLWAPSIDWVITDWFSSESTVYTATNGKGDRV